MTLRDAGPERSKSARGTDGSNPSCSTGVQLFRGLSGGRKLFRQLVVDVHSWVIPRNLLCPLLANDADSPFLRCHASWRFRQMVVCRSTLRSQASVALSTLVQDCRSASEPETVSTG